MEYRPRYLYAELASAIDARKRCAKTDGHMTMKNPEWFDKHTERNAPRPENKQEETK